MRQSRGFIGLGAFVVVGLLSARARAQEGGWAFADQPTASDYAPKFAYSWNSTGGSIVLTNTGVGVYEARFSGLGGLVGGTVLVSSYNDPTGAYSYCNVDNWRNDGVPGSPRLLITVRCYSANGNPVHSRYTLIYSRFTGSTPSYSSYAFMDRTNTSGALSPAYQWNSDGGPWSVNYDGSDSSYFVIRSGLEPLMPTAAMVSPYSQVGIHCRADFPSGFINPFKTADVVRCYGANGQPVTSRFTITLGDTPFQTPSSTFGWAYSSGSPNGAYIMINGSKRASGTSGILKLATGRYYVLFDHLPHNSRTIAMVSTMSGPALRCGLETWGDNGLGSSYVIALCRDASGNPADGVFIAAMGSN
jgi:hypothetical protein